MVLKSFVKKSVIAGVTIWLSMFSAVAQIKQLTLSINPGKTYQTIDNFGASDAWACQFVGNWPDDKKNKIADLLFSDENYADGSPKGIGLSMWRFNVGAGSAEQGKASGIRDEWRRAESFLDADDTYNWNKQAGQVWFLKAAKKRKVPQFLGFTNSPPVKYTINGKAYANRGKINIAPEHYADFASYLARVIQGVEKISKVKFNYISPVNEPQWDWSDGGQEGCPYTNAEIAGLVKAIDKTFIAGNVHSKIIIGEAGSINYLFTKGDKPGKGYQINDFFKAASPGYLGNLPSVAPAITAHSYFTTSPMTASVKARKALADSVDKISGLTFWQSEYCILGDNAGEINGSHRDLGIDAALYMASVIHTDLTVANASAWQWWTAISAYDYKDGLIYIDKNKTDGNFYTSKMLWVLGNYSRFIKPGAKRIDVSLSKADLKKPLLISAYKNKRGLAVVIVNQNSEDMDITLDTNDGKIKFTTSYTTSATDGLKAATIAKSAVVVKARSVMTLSGKFK
ncbi:glycoside hydrolase [Mucilaginibacter panaciglaebae]|uniref:Glycoside hydrolase family 30 protein n=1 Tax=Mucilaginibacter panaciglaebae TaxID=502331 RepID=A0ABP7X3A4_9SPHI